MPKKTLIRKCWARSLGDCQGGLSREHVISKGIAAAISSDLINHGRHDGLKDIGVNSMTIKYICRHHNSLLSEFDEEASKIIKELHLALLTDKTKEHPSVTINVDGRNFERWLAKTFYNVLAFHEISSDSDLDIFNISHIELVNFLFQKDRIDHPLGLYILPPGTNYLKTDKEWKKELKLKVIHQNGHIHRKKDNEISPKFRFPQFLYISIFGLEFIFNFNLLAMHHVDRNKIVDSLFQNDPIIKIASYRPNFIKIFSSTNAVGISDLSAPIIQFDWNVNN